MTEKQKRKRKMTSGVGGGAAAKMRQMNSQHETCHGTRMMSVSRDQYSDGNDRYLSKFHIVEDKMSDKQGEFRTGARSVSKTRSAFRTAEVAVVTFLIYFSANSRETCAFTLPQLLVQRKTHCLASSPSPVDPKLSVSLGQKMLCHDAFPPIKCAAFSVISSTRRHSLSKLFYSSSDINQHRTRQNEDRFDKDVEYATEKRKFKWLQWLAYGNRQVPKTNGTGKKSGNSVDFKDAVEDDDADEEEDDEQSEWLWWLSTGIRKRKLNYEDVKLREDKRLGGVPRAIGYSAKDWWHNTLTLPTSAILRDIRSPVTFMLFWGGMISIIYRRLEKINPIMASHMTIPSQPHSLLVSSLGLLLVFRTNSAYQRFVEGRKIWEDILSISRDLSRMVQIFEKFIGAQKKRRVLRLLAAFPYLLRHRIRPNLLFRKLLDPNYPRDPEHSLLLYDDIAQLDNDSEAAGVANDEEETGMSRRKPRELCWVDKRTLPWRLLPKEALAGCARAQNRPLWVCDRMSKELATVPDQEGDGFAFTNRERMAFLDKVDKLSHCIGQCERIHQTVVPLNYARHSLRSLTMWLLTLPFALVKDLGFFTGPVVAIMSWLLFGVYEIGYSIEDPFQGTLRLSILCDGIRRDVLGDLLHRETAFDLGDKDDDDDDDDDDDESRLPSLEKKDPNENTVTAKGTSSISGLPSGSHLDSSSYQDFPKIPGVDDKTAAESINVAPVGADLDKLDQSLKESGNTSGEQLPLSSVVLSNNNTVHSSGDLNSEISHSDGTSTNSIEPIIQSSIVREKDSFE